MCISSFSRTQKRIDFWLVHALEKYYNCSIAPHVANYMCTSAPAQLLYVEAKRGCRPKVRSIMLDSSVSCPRTTLPITTKRDVRSLLCVRCNDEQLLITTGLHSGAAAHNVETDQRVWKVKGMKEGMRKEISACSTASDGRGHLFVCDRNNPSVQMYSCWSGK